MHEVFPFQLQDFSLLLIELNDGLIQQWVYVFPNLSFVTYVLVEALLVAFDTSFNRFNSFWALAFLTLSLPA